MSRPVSQRRVDGLQTVSQACLRDVVLLLGIAPEQDFDVRVGRQDQVVNDSRHDLHVYVVNVGIVDFAHNKDSLVVDHLRLPRCALFAE